VGFLGLVNRYKSSPTLDGIDSTASTRRHRLDGIDSVVSSTTLDGLLSVVPASTLGQSVVSTSALLVVTATTLLRHGGCRGVVTASSDGHLEGDGWCCWNEKHKRMNSDRGGGG